MNDIFDGSKEPLKQKVKVNFHISPGNNDRIKVNPEEIQAENPSLCHHDSETESQSKLPYLTRKQ